MRRACSGRLRFAYYHWARTAVQNDQRSRAHYAALRSRGKSHGRALRGVVDRLLAVAVAMLRAGTLYDPSLRGLPETQVQSSDADQQVHPCIRGHRSAGT
jgi:hypothetical protein